MSRHPAMMSACVSTTDVVSTQIALLLTGKRQREWTCRLELEMVYSVFLEPKGDGHRQKHTHNHTHTHTFFRCVGLRTSFSSAPVRQANLRWQSQAHTHFSIFPGMSHGCGPCFFLDGSLSVNVRKLIMRVDERSRFYAIALL